MGSRNALAIRGIPLGALVTVFCLPAIGAGGESCPWMNAATAGGALGAAVKTSVRHPNANKDDASCDFIGKRGGLVYGLQIEVVTMAEAGRKFASYAARCGSEATPLTAIGNEALSCSHDDENGHRTAQVVGRVRNRAFVIRMGTTDSSMTLQSLRETVRAAAEQVAGNLF